MMDRDEALALLREMTSFPTLTDREREAISVIVAEVEKHPADLEFFADNADEYFETANEQRRRAERAEEELARARGDDSPVATLSEHDPVTDEELAAARKRIAPYVQGYPKPMIDARRLRMANGTASVEDIRQVRAEDIAWREAEPNG